MPVRLSLALMTAAIATPAYAHTGDHSFLRTSVDALWHVLEPDHVVFALLTLLVGIMAYRAGRNSGRRAEARVHVSKDKPHDPR
jgi:hypothetical protein